MNILLTSDIEEIFKTLLSFGVIFALLQCFFCLLYTSYWRYYLYVAMPGQQPDHLVFRLEGSADGGSVHQPQGG